MKPQTRPILPIATCIRVCMGMHAVNWLYAHAYTYAWAYTYAYGYFHTHIHTHIHIFIRIYIRIFSYAYGRNKDFPRYLYGQPVRVQAAHTRMGQENLPIRVWAAHTRMGSPYAYGIAHTRMGKIRVWDRTVILKTAFFIGETYRL